jgi:death-on-curing protein
MAIHEEMIRRYGGASGLRDRGQLESAVAQPLMTFDGIDLYKDLAEKSAAMCFSLIKNHPFVDGNKRVGFAAMRLLVRSNGFRLKASIDEKEHITLSIASGTLSRDDLVEWIREHVHTQGS